jgi:protein-tyrosine phosphatase
MTEMADLLASITAADGRHLPVPGTLNFRDTGGYPAAGGSTRWQALLRSDALNRLTGPASGQLASLGLNTVLDLRTVIETEIAPSPLDDFAGRGTAAWHISILGEDLTELPGELADIYDFLVDHRGSQLGAALRVLAAPGALPALVHCTAGKDRTGLVIAMTLAVLGVPDEVIAADYALSSAYLDPRYTLAIGQIQANTGLGEDLTEALMASPPELMLRTLDRARAAGGGSIVGYLRRHGVIQADVAALRAALIVPAGPASPGQFG